jgi:predicted amidohydrolase YtcJ
MNAAARERYQFGPDACWAEMIWRMMPDYLAMPEVQARYVDYMAMLNGRGVTSIKEMTFDDYYGFADVMARMEDAGQMTLRVSMMSQPVGRGADIEHGKRMRDRFHGPFVTFSGYNRMTDRGVAGGLAEYVDPYDSKPGMRVAVPVEWDLIERETHEVDAAGFRYSLHCQGDGAVRHTVRLLDSCAKDAAGRLVNRHAITDLECSCPSDLDLFGSIGGICEVYPQIQTLDAEADIESMAIRQVGPERFSRFWNRRRMWDAGARVCCGTDLPLLVPHIGESIYAGCGGYFDDGVAVNQANMLSVGELLQAWTANGAYDCYSEDRLGTLEEGKTADVVVLDGDVFHTDPANVRGIGAALTISDGRIVHDALR